MGKRFLSATAEIYMGRNPIATLIAEGDVSATAENLAGVEAL